MFQFKIAGILAAASLVTANVTNTTMAQQPCASGYCADSNCGCVQTPPPPVYPQMAQQGVFANGQPSGDVAGESGSIGVRGFSLRFPELKLEFPTLQLPSFFRFRRDAEVFVDSSRAPYVAGQPAIFGQINPGGQLVNVNGTFMTTSNAALLQQQGMYGTMNSFNTQGQADFNVERTLLDQLEQERLEKEEMHKKLEQLERCVQDALMGQTQHPHQSYLQPTQNVRYESEEEMLQREIAKLQLQIEMKQAARKPAIESQYQQKCQEVTELNERLKAMETMCAQLAREQETKLFLERRARLMNQFDQQQSAPQTLPVNNVKHINFVEKAPTPLNEQPEVIEKKSSELDSSLNDSTPKSFEEKLEW